MQTLVWAIVFGIFYTLLFLFLFKTKALKPNFAAIFFFSSILYFALTLLMTKYLDF
ncbi:MAG: hypothetical protein LBQ47_05900 [Endomicrobium sp.]|nr:hypothetical protein [Endomicrobium sp.]